eukprot:1055086-Rhodomonas_salina.1
MAANAALFAHSGYWCTFLNTSSTLVPRCCFRVLGCSRLSMQTRTCTVAVEVALDSGSKAFKLFKLKTLAALPQGCVVSRFKAPIWFAGSYPGTQVPRVHVLGYRGYSVAKQKVLLSAFQSHIECMCISRMRKEQIPKHAGHNS